MANLQQDEYCTTTQQHQHHMHGSRLSVSCNIGLHPTLPQDGCNIDCRISQLEVHASTLAMYTSQAGWCCDTAAMQVCRAAAATAAA